MKKYSKNHSIFKTFTLVEIMIVVAIITVLATLLSLNLLRSKLHSAEANAQATLRAISTALESYASAKSGAFPVGNNLSLLYNEDPKYINKEYVADCTAESPCQGYAYSCNLSLAGYTCSATPQGSYYNAKTFTVETGGILKEFLNQ